MAERRLTPDVLAEVLGGESPAGLLPVGSVRSLSPAGWEVEIVTFQDARGWRSRFVNGNEVSRWMEGEPIHEAINQRGMDGWELTGATALPRMYGAADGVQLYFKRRLR